MQKLDAAVARGEQAAFKQRRADTQALPRLLDAEGSLGLAPVERPKDAHIGGATQHPMHEEAVQDNIAAVHRFESYRYTSVVVKTVQNCTHRKTRAVHIQILICG